LTIALLDGDIVIYTAVVVNATSIDWEDGSDPVVTSDVEAAKANADHIIEKWTAAAGAQVPVVCLTDRSRPVFRRDICPDYKAGRKDKPEGYWEVEQHVREKHLTYAIPGLEADDVMGILSTSQAPQYAGAVIVSLDKDMKTIPGMLLNPTKDMFPRRVRAPLADQFWMTQTLTGDPTDGYKGCPRIGAVKAEAILGAAGLRLPDMWRAVVDTFLSAGLTEADALLQARLARILRREDYDKQTNEVLLWHPTTPTRLSLTTVPTSPPGATSPKASAPTSPSTGPSPSPAKSRPRKSRARSS
jgi:hypothetical protein